MTKKHTDYSRTRTFGRNARRDIGEARGEANATNRMVKSFKDQEFPVEAIAKAANLSVEEVNGIN